MLHSAYGPQRGWRSGTTTQVVQNLRPVKDASTYLGRYVRSTPYGEHCGSTNMGQNLHCRGLPDKEVSSVPEPRNYLLGNRAQIYVCTYMYTQCRLGLDSPPYIRCVGLYPCMNLHGFCKASSNMITNLQVIPQNQC